MITALFHFFFRRSIAAKRRASQKIRRGAAPLLPQSLLIWRERNTVQMIFSLVLRGLRIFINFFERN